MSSPTHPHHLPLAYTEASVEERFRRLAAEWKEQSRYLSNTAQMAMLKPYQRIIGLGLPVVPLILEELNREPNQWFWALEAITEQNPVPPEAQGKVRMMAQAWIEWGKHKATWRNDLARRFPAPDGSKPSHYQSADTGLQLHRLVGGRCRTLVAAGRSLADRHHQ